MTEPNETAEPSVDDVLVPTEPTRPDHREHAKTPKHLDDDLLDAKVAQERQETAGD